MSLFASPAGVLSLLAMTAFALEAPGKSGAPRRRVLDVEPLRRLRLAAAARVYMAACPASDPERCHSDMRLWWPSDRSGLILARAVLSRTEGDGR
jgi:hypothetical protein